MKNLHKILLGFGIVVIVILAVNWAYAAPVKFENNIDLQGNYKIINSTTTVTNATDLVPKAYVDEAVSTNLTGSGTSGYVTYWTGSGSSLSGESNLFWDAGNNYLGIGIASPSTALHVIGSSTISGNLDIGGAITGATFAGTMNAANISSGEFGSNTAGGNYYFPASVGIGTASPDQLLTITSAFSSSPTGNIRFVKTGTNTPEGGSYIQFDTSVSATARGVYNARIEGIRTASGGGGSGELRFFTTEVNVSSVAQERMRIAYDGKVGIGTASPSYNLDVAGTGRFTGGLTVSGDILLPHTDAWGYIKNPNNSGGLRFGTATAGGTYQNLIEISAAGGYVKLNKNTTIAGNLSVYETTVGAPILDLRGQDTASATNFLQVIPAKENGYGTDQYNLAFEQQTSGSRILYFGASAGTLGMNVQGDLTVGGTVTASSFSGTINADTLDSHDSSYFVATGGDTMTGNLVLSSGGVVIIQHQESTSNYTSPIKWYKGGASQATYDPQIGQHNTGGTGTGSIAILPYPTETSPWGGTVGLFITEGTIAYKGNTVWHAGNDGSGSGLDADKLDAISSGSFLRSDVNDTFTGAVLTLDSGAQMSTRLISSIGTELGVGAGETGAQFNSNMSGEILWLGGESGVKIISSPDNWGSGWAGRNEATLVDASGNSSLPGDLTVSGASTNFRNAIKAVDGSGSGIDADLLDGIGSGSFLRSNTSDTFTGKLIASDSNRQSGIYGTYDSYDIDHVWSMGTAYDIATDGSTFGNLYGMAYCHTNNANCKSGYGHQIEFVQNGTVGIALGFGGSAWFSGTVTASSFSGTIDADTLDGISSGGFARYYGRVVTDLNNYAGSSSGFYGISGTAANSPEGSYQAMINARNSDVGFQLVGGYTTDDLWYRGWSGSGATFYPWRRLWHDNNDGSGSGLDADKLDGYHGASASTASTYALRNSSGDINARLFRSEYDSTNASVNYIMTQIDTASNNYIRPSTPAQVRSALDVWVNTSGDTMTGTLSMNNNAILNINWAGSDDGSGSGLDADLFDGRNSDDFVDDDGDRMYGNLDMHNHDIIDAYNISSVYKITMQADGQGIDMGGRTIINGYLGMHSCVWKACTSWNVNCICNQGYYVAGIRPDEAGACNWYVYCCKL